MIKKVSVAVSGALLFAGCAKRQTTPRIVYLPAPPAATTQRVTGGVLIIQQPEAPETSAAPSPMKPLANAPERRPETIHVQPALPRLTPTPVPTLAPRESLAQQEALRSTVMRSQQEVERAIERLRRSDLPENEQGTLGGAQVFLAQSIRALQDGDLERALNLVRKAQLLVRALESSP